jgi:PKD repeat protein
MPITVLVAVLTATLSIGPSAYGGVTVFGGPGPGPGHFTTATGIAIEPDGSVLVTDSTSEILHYANDGSFLGTIGSRGSGTSPVQFQGPMGIAVDPAGDVFVADTGNSRVVILSPSFTFLRSIGLGAPAQVAVDASALYVLSDVGIEMQLYKFANASDNYPLAGREPSYGSGDDQMAMNGASWDQMAVDSTGDLLIVDSENQRVLRYDSSLAFVDSWTVTGRARGLAIGNYAGAEQVYAGDLGSSSNQRVLRTDALGHLAGSFGPAMINGRSVSPGAIAADAAGNVFILDGGGTRILRVTPTPSASFSATPTGGLTSQAATFDGSASAPPFWSINDFQWDLDGSGLFATDAGSLPTISKRFDLPGTYAIGLRVATTNGLTASTSMNFIVGSSHAEFVAPATTLTGSDAQFDATASAIPYSTVTDYAWDFDGSGSYANDGGTSPTISNAFATPGTYTVELRVTRAGGRLDFANRTILVTQAPALPPVPPPGLVGASINDGDYATNNPRVSVNVVWPRGAIQALLSNDGGFGRSGGTTTRSLAATIPWMLAQTGAERLPKTVFLRFLGAGIDLQNFTDDIILDQTPPTIQSAQLLDGSPPSSAAISPASFTRSRQRLHSYRINIKAQDKIVGVCAIAASQHKSGGAIIAVKNCHRRGTLRFSKTVTLRSAMRPKFVRVQNSAGNWSHWIQARH